MNTTTLKVKSCTRRGDMNATDRLKKQMDRDMNVTDRIKKQMDRDMNVTVKN